MICLHAVKNKIRPDRQGRKGAGVVQGRQAKCLCLPQLTRPVIFTTQLLHSRAWNHSVVCELGVLLFKHQHVVNKL